MKDKISLPQDFIVRQEKWEEAPCFYCTDSICCCLLPLVSFELKNRADFISLAVLSCYPHLQLGLKKSFEWTVYYKRNCLFFNESSRKCRIHGLAAQSIVCKTYDAHNCWYREALHIAPGKELILFDLERLLWLEKQEEDYSWDELSFAVASLPGQNIKTFPAGTKYSTDYTLDFSIAGENEYLFFPPYKKPERIAHFELMKFRLGFPGIFLCLVDNCWAYLLNTEPDMTLFRRLRDEYYPGLTLADNCFHFRQVNKEKLFYSGLGNKWVVVRLHHLDALKTCTTADAFGNITRLPTSKEVLEIIRTINPLPVNPDKAA